MARVVGGRHGTGGRALTDDFDQVLDGARRGDEPSARRLFERHQPMLLRFLRSQEPRVAEDLAGEVWVGVASGLHRFEGDAAGFRAWLFTIARRRVIEHRRRGVRRPTTAAEPAELAERPDRAADPAVGLGAQEAVDRLLAGLTEDQAAVLSLRILADLDVGTVARLLDRSEGWVRVTQHRALRRLARDRERAVDSDRGGVTK